MPSCIRRWLIFSIVKVSELGHVADSTSLHEILANSRRRHALDILGKSDSPLALADLATDIADREASTPEGEKTHAQQIHLHLYHTHIPKMEDKGIVQYDSDRRTVALTESQ